MSSKHCSMLVISEQLICHGRKRGEGRGLVHRTCTCACPGASGARPGAWSCTCRAGRARLCWRARRLPPMWPPWGSPCPRGRTWELAKLGIKITFPNHNESKQNLSHRFTAPRKNRSTKNLTKSSSIHHKFWSQPKPYEELGFGTTSVKEKNGCSSPYKW